MLLNLKIYRKCFLFKRLQHKGQAHRPVPYEKEKGLNSTNQLLLNRQFYPVTAPSDADETEFAYFAITPRV